MNIYKITQLEEQTDWNYFNAHVIIANSTYEVRQLAKAIAGEEGEETWDYAELKDIGIYTGNETEPFVVLSDFIQG